MRLKTTLLIICSVFFCYITPYGQTYEVYKGDTINRMNPEKVKTGKWILFHNGTDKIYQTGNYSDGKRNGNWITYYTNGNKKSEITYQYGEKRGYAKVYFENGNLAEEGTWDNDKWIGKYMSYYQNGKLSYVWNYNEKGSRCGYQKYYYENGKIKIEGEWKDGKEIGMIREYYESGALKSEKTFTEGNIQDIDLMTYGENEDVQVGDNNELITDITEVSDTINVEKKEDTVKIFKGNGYYIFYNKFKEIEKEGYFKNGLLINGKHHIYSEEGILQKTYIYTEGKITEVKNEE